MVGTDLEPAEGGFGVRQNRNFFARTSLAHEQGLSTRVR